MAQLVGDDSGQFVRRLCLGDQALEDVNLSTRKRNGIRLLAAHHAGAQRHWQCGFRFEARDQRGKRGASGPLADGFSAFKRHAGDIAAQAGAQLRVHRLTQFAFHPEWQERRQARGKRGQGEQGHSANRCYRDDDKCRDLHAHAPLHRAGAVDGRRLIVDALQRKPRHLT